jgi:predicted nucleic acid-binding protein
MIVLDTNVVSEPWRPQPNAAVLGWLRLQPPNVLFLCTPVLAELRYGVERLPAGRRRDRLKASVDQVEAEGYRDRILPLDEAAAAEFGHLTAKREKIGRRISTMDALIAAITLTHGAVLATRDTDDFSDLGFKVINPFGATGAG